MTISAIRLVQAGVLCLALLAGGGNSVCAQNCDQPGDLAERAECAKLRLRAAEREMLAQMRLIESQEDDALKRAMAAAQDAWLKWRDAEGEVAAVAAGDEAERQRAERDGVKAQLTEDRVRDLRAHTGQ